MKIILAGTYPQGTVQKLQEALAPEKLEIVQAATEAEFALEKEADAIILRVLKMPAAVINRFSSRLKLIMRWGVGYDSVDIKAARARGIAVCNTPGANAYAVSELTVLLMLAVGRKLLCHAQSLREGVWSRNTFLSSSTTLNKKLVGIIGGGNIGRQVAKKVQAFGARTQYYDLYRLPAAVEQEYQLVYVSLEQLLATSDLVTLHVPLTDANRHFLGAAQLAAMKPGAIVINAARGGLIDETALVAAVDSGHLAGAGLDCVEQEPLAAADPLLENPNIVVTPHVGGTANDIGEMIIPMLGTNLKHLLKGEKLQYVVNEVQ